MAYGSNLTGYGGGGYGTEDQISIPIVTGAQGCTPVIQDVLGNFWALTVDDQGELVINSVTVRLAHQSNPFLDSGAGTWQLGIDANQFVTLTLAIPPPIPNQPILSYIPLLSPGGFPFKLTVDRDGNLSLSSTVDSNGNATLLPDIIPRPVDVSMSLYGDPGEILFCANCGNASVTAGADLSLWCCTCSSFIPPEDSNVLRFLDE